MAMKRKPVTHKDVASSHDGLKASMLPVCQCKGSDCLRTWSLERWFGGVDGMLGVNSGLLPVLAGVTALTELLTYSCFV